MHALKVERMRREQSIKEKKMAIKEDEMAIEVINKQILSIGPLIGLFDASSESNASDSDDDTSDSDDD